MPRKRQSSKDLPNPADLAESVPLRTLPQALDAERGLLGSLLVDGERVMGLCADKRVVPEAFFEPSHRSVYIAIEHLAAKGQPIDGVTVSNFLTGTGELERIGGLQLLTQLAEAMPTSAHAGYYADIVMERYLRRVLLGTARTIAEDAYDASLGVDYLLSMAEQKVLAIGEGRTQQSSTLDWKTSVGESLAALRNQFDKPGQFTGLPSGFKGLDEKMRGLQKGAMIVLAARPAMGKTSLAMNIAECVARGKDIMERPFREPERRKHTVLVFSLEMPQEQLTKRMLCGMANVSARAIESGLVRKETQLPLLEAAARELETLPIFCDDQGGLDVMELRARARHVNKRHPLDLIVIDYLQLLNYREFAQQGQQVMVSKISGEIKAMAKELNVPVIVLSQLSRNSEQRGGDEKPKNSDLRDSGAIEQDADMILLLRRPCYMGSRVPEHDDATLAIVDVSKNRNGATGEVRLNFDGSVTRFKDRIEINPNMIPGDMEPVNTP